METRQTGELVSTKPFVLNLGYDGRDTHNVTVKSGTWVKLEADKQVRQMEGEELAKRQELRTEAEALRKQADEATSQLFPTAGEQSPRAGFGSGPRAGLRPHAKRRLG